jgi:sugar transferase EpsL
METPAVSRTPWARFGKRASDAVVAAVLLILLSPLFVVVAFLIKLTSRGPVFFVQERGGYLGKSFVAPKFRTMRGGRTPDPKELVPLDHPEITPLGRWLRRSKIDELPQLWCVLTGEMSLVGPRPTLPDQVSAYDEFRRQRLLVLPGVTGLAQVNGSTALSWDERILYDIAYVRRCSLWLDLTILTRTALVILLGEARFARPFSRSPYSRFVTPPPGYSVPGML